MNASSVIGYSFAAIFCLLGMLLIINIITIERMEPNYRYMFGGVLMVWGVYRLFMTRWRQRRAAEQEEQQEEQEQ
ncbi:MAG: hypothetical protein V1799_16105 [bacterium]